MKLLSKYNLLTIAVTTLAATPLAFAESIPSVVVTVKNQAAQRSGLQTPVWAGIHDGTFDLYDRNVALGDASNNSQLISRESVERIAEDGVTDPITEEFSSLQSNAPQTTFVAPGGPLQPGARVSTTLNISDPSVQRYFSYASMVIPSNDAFVANGNPLAHEIFNAKGHFVAKDFIVAGSEVLDAGTEVNDEIAGNTAFLNQAGPDIGEDETGGVVTLSQGFAAPGSLTYPDGVLNHPAFGNADFTAAGARTLQFGFRYVDLGGWVKSRTVLSPRQEVGPKLIDSKAVGKAFLSTRYGEKAYIYAWFAKLSSNAVAAHLHLGQAGVNGPVVVDLTPGLESGKIQFKLPSGQVKFKITAGDISGPLAADKSKDPFRSFLNELAAGNIYVNIHTKDNPSGELRGQLQLY